MTAARLATCSLPFATAILIPVIPLLVQLADVSPRGVPLGSRGFAIGLAVFLGVLCLAAVAGLVARHGMSAFTRPPLALPIAAVIASEIIAAIGGVSFRAGAFEIASTIGVMVGYFALWWTMSDRTVRRAWLACFLSSSLLASAFAIALTLTRHPPAAFAYVHGRAAGTFIAPNEFAGYLLFVIPLGIAQIAAPPALSRLGIAAATVGVVGLTLSVSRAAWLGLLFGMFVLMVRFGRRALIGYAVAAACALALGATALRDVAHDPSENASRIIVWRGAARMVERFALVGVGPLGFSRVYPMFKEPSATTDEVHAHDLPLNVLVENGILGFAAFAWAIIASLRAARSAGGRIAADDRERLLLFCALGAAFAASAVQNSVDVVTTFALVMWWPMVGLMLALGRQDAPTRVV